MLEVMKFGAPSRLSDLLKYELNENFCRENITFADGVAGKSTVYEVGHLLATKDDKAVHWNPAASDGTEAVTGVNLYRKTVHAEASGHTGVKLERGAALLNIEKIVWPDDVTDEQKTAALEMLSERNIKAR